MARMGDIEETAEQYRGVRDDLSARVTEMEREVEDVKRRHMPAIRELAGRATDLQAKLREQVREAQGVFTQQQRTITVSGIRVGWRKTTGKVKIRDGKRTAELIRKHFPDRYDDLVQVEYKPVKSALAKLSAGELQKLNVSLEGGHDEVVIKPQDSEIDKIVDKLLEDDKQHNQEGA